MTGRMIEFDANGSAAPGYLATPESGAGPGVVVLHEWWGLTEPFRRCLRQARGGGLRRARPRPLSRQDDRLGRGSGGVERGAGPEGRAVARRHRGRAAVPAPKRRNHPGGRARRVRPSRVLAGRRLRARYVRHAPDEIAAVVSFYATYPGLDYRRAKAAYLFHFAEHDQYESVGGGRQDGARASRRRDRQVTVYTYPGTKHWFVGFNRPDAYDAAATALAWERTLAFLNAELRR